MRQAIKKCLPYLVHVAIIMFVPVFNLVSALKTHDYDLAVAWFMSAAAVGCMMALMILVQHLRHVLTDLEISWRREVQSNERLANAVIAARMEQSVRQLTHAEQQATWN